jgi:hypothetical protein
VARPTDDEALISCKRHLVAYPAGKPAVLPLVRHVRGHVR